MSAGNSNYKKANIILTKLSKSMNWLLANDIADVDMTRLLGSFGEVLGVNRAYVFRKYGPDDINCYYKQVYEWTDTTVKSELNNDILQNLSCYDDSILSVHQLLLNDEPFIGNVKDMPPCTREVLERQGIISIAIIPIFSPCVKKEPKLWGFVGFDDCTVERAWDELEINALYALGALVRTIIAKINKNNKKEKIMSYALSRMKEANLNLSTTNQLLENKIRNIN